MKRYWKTETARPDGNVVVITTMYRCCESSPGPQWVPADDEVECIDGQWYYGPKPCNSQVRSEKEGP